MQDRHISKGLHSVKLAEEDVLKADANLVDMIADVLVDYYESNQDIEVVVSSHLVNDTKVMLTYVNPSTLDSQFVFFNTANLFLDWSDDVDIKELIINAVNEWANETDPEHVY